MILPFPARVPIGGVKAMYEYANRLQERGHEVFIYHVINTSFLTYKTPAFCKVFILQIIKAEWPKWFQLNNNIHSKIIKKVSNASIRTEISLYLLGGLQPWKLTSQTNQKGENSTLSSRLRDMEWQYRECYINPII
jgi:hypothetical protein